MTIKEIYHQIESLEAQAAQRDLTDQEFDQISRLQDQISDIEHPGYEMRESFGTVNNPNDHLMFTVFSKEDGKPIDSFKIYREEDRYLVRSSWKGIKEAREWAKQVLSKWV